jgi:hypothetical protein
MIVVTGSTSSLRVDPNSRIGIAIDTPMKRFYAEHVAYLDARDYVGLVENHYCEDAMVMSTEYIVIGREALYKHFAKYAGLMAHLRVISTDRWIESENTFAFEATAHTQWGLTRVHDAFVLRDGKIYRHFTGSIPLIR